MGESSRLNSKLLFFWSTLLFYRNTFSCFVIFTGGETILLSFIWGSKIFRVPIIRAECMECKKGFHTWIFPDVPDNPSQV